ncbi:MAG: flagellar biosynthetic protein FliR [Deltaproteobacteria bacterium]|jgi:flagellar biosynthetic protein FliR|nr:flagellar biosynthetic protein FliR [Deltaproteobacteria bacterium]
MISLSIPQDTLQVFFLIFLRVGAILMSMPVLKSRSIPVLFKAGLALAASIVLYPLVDRSAFAVPGHLGSFAIGAASEVLLGISIGMVVNLIFVGLQMAGQISGYQMGLAIAHVMDPSAGQQVPLLSQFFQLFAFLMFLTLNAHHWFLRALADSFELVRPFGFRLSGSLIEQLMDVAGNTFVIAIKVGAPVIAVLMITSIAFGLIARTVPQMNVLFVAMPLKIMVGLMFIGFSLPYLSSFLRTVFSNLDHTIFVLMKAASQ